MEIGVEIEYSICALFRASKGERGGDISGSLSPSSPPMEKAEHKKKIRKAALQITGFDLIKMCFAFVPITGVSNSGQ